MTAGSTAGARRNEVPVLPADAGERGDRDEAGREQPWIPKCTCGWPGPQRWRRCSAQEKLGSAGGGFEEFPSAEHHARSCSLAAARQRVHETKGPGREGEPEPGSARVSTSVKGVAAGRFGSGSRVCASLKGVARPWELRHHSPSGISHSDRGQVPQVEAVKPRKWLQARRPGLPPGAAQGHEGVGLLASLRASPEIRTPQSPEIRSPPTSGIGVSAGIGFRGRGRAHGRSTARRTGSPPGRRRVPGAPRRARSSSPAIGRSRPARSSTRASPRGSTPASSSS